MQARCRYLCGDAAGPGSKRGDGGEGLGRQASASEDTCGQNLVKFSGVQANLCWLLVSLVVKVVRVICRAGQWERQSLAVWLLSSPCLSSRS